MPDTDKGWYFSIPWQDQESAVFKHMWAIRDELAKREPRFSSAKGEFDFHFLGKIGDASFNRIRATPDTKTREVRVLLQYDDEGYVSKDMETAFAFPLHRLTGDPAQDATLYAANLQHSLQELYLKNENMRDGFQPKWEAAFAPALGTETPILAFMDRAEAVQKAHTAIQTRRIIALTDHLRDDVPSIPRTLPAAAGAGSDHDMGGRN